MQLLFPEMYCEYMKITHSKGLHTIIVHAKIIPNAILTHCIFLNTAPYENQAWKGFLAPNLLQCKYNKAFSKST